MTTSANRVARRLGRVAATVVPVAFLSTIATFGLTYLSPANPAVEILGPTATPQEIASMTHQLGLDRPFVVQYLTWLGNALHGNLGTSYFTSLPVAHSLVERLPVDISIAAIAVVIAVVVGVPGGIAAATHRDRLIDTGVTWMSSVLLTMPEFLLGILLVTLFAVRLRVLPSSGYVGPTTDPATWLAHLILPSLALAAEPAADIARQLRTSLVSVMEADFVTGAAVRGLSPARVLFGHVLRNAAPAAVTALGLQLPRLIGGAVIVETVFALPGIGQFALQGAQSHDIPVIQGVLVTVIGLVLVCNLVVDALVGWLRPTGRS